MGVDSALYQSIADPCELLLCYEKPLLVPHGDEFIDVSCSPKRESDDRIQFPSATCYALDKSFNGPEAFPAIAQEFAECCRDCSLFVQKNAHKYPRSDYLLCELRCSCYKVQHRDMSKFSVGRFTKTNTRTVTNKSSDQKISKLSSTEWPTQK